MPFPQYGLETSPKWYKDNLEKILQEAEFQAKKKYEPYGKLSKEQKNNLDKKLYQLKKLETHTGKGFPLSVTGKSRPVEFTKRQLERAYEDPVFARDIYSSSIGRENVPEKDIINFQERIKIKYPSIGKFDKDEQENKYFENRKILENSLYDIEEKIHQKNIDLEKEDIDKYLNDKYLNDKYIIDSKKEIDSLNQTINNYKKNYGIDPIDPNRLPFRLGLPNMPNDNLKALEAQKKIQVINEKIEEKAKEKVKEKISEEYLKKNNPFYENKNEIEKNIEKIDKENEKYTLEGPSIFERIKAPFKIKELMANESNPRIAPMNQTHEQARTRLENNFDDDSIQTAKNEILEAKKENIPRTIKPFIEGATEFPEELINQYMNNYQKNVIQSLKDETQENFFDTVAPKINLSLAQYGSYHSGARNKLLSHAAQQTQKHLNREIAHLLSGAHDKAMQHSQAAQNRKLSAGEVMGNAVKNEQEGLRANAELLRQQGISKKALEHQDIAALSQMAKQEQEQAQHAIDVSMHEQNAAKQHQWEQLERQSAIAQGYQAPAKQMFTSQQLGQPAAPSGYNLAAGLTSMVPGMMANQQTYAKGGHVRFAKGGHASRFNELRNQVRAGPEEHTLKDIGREMRESRVNPMADYLMASGAYQLASPTGNPLKNFGIASVKAMNDMRAARNFNLSSQEKASNLYSKINESRLYQQQVLAQYENQREVMEQNQQHRQASLDQADQYHKNLLATRNQQSFGMSPQDLKREAELKKNYEEEQKQNENETDAFNLIKKSVDEGIGLTGPIAGRLPNKLVTWFNSKKLTNRRTFNQGMTEKVLNKLATQKGTQSDKDMEVIRETVPSLKDEPEFIDAWVNNVDKVLQRRKEYEKFIDSSMDQGYSMQQAKKEWKKYVNEHPLISQPEDTNSNPIPTQEESLEALKELRIRGLIE